MPDSSTLVDRVKIFVESSGTGPFQLGNALPSFRGSEALVDGLTYSYAVESGSDYEVGQGVYVLAVDQLIRSPTLSSNGGAPVAFPANVAVNFTALAADLTAGLAGSGTVTSVQGSGGTTGLTLTGGPITGAGTLTLGGTLGLANGGTGGTDGATARAGIGLGNVDNTSDADKPISTATQTALDAKVATTTLSAPGGAAQVGTADGGTAQDFIDGINLFELTTYGLTTGTDPADWAANDAALQAALNAISAAGGGVLNIPAGRYYFQAGASIDYGTLPDPLFGRVSIRGAGSGATELAFPVSITEATLLTITGGTWGTAETGADIFIEGLRFRGGYANPAPTGGNTGIHLQSISRFSTEDVEFVEFTYATRFEDVLNYQATRTRWNFNNYGLYADGPNAPLLGSDPNIYTFVHCTGVGNRQYAHRFVKGGNLVYLGGSFEGNSHTGAWTSDTNRATIFLDQMGVNAATAVSILGTHFENNAGDADIVINHDQRPCNYQIDGADFFRNGAVGAQNADHHILFNTTGAAKARVKVRAGFGSVNGYVGSTSTRVIEEGTITGTPIHTWDLEGCTYEDLTEKPSLPGANNVAESRASAWVNFNGSDVAINSEFNVESVTKDSTGIYTINFKRAMKNPVFAISTSKAAPGCVYKIGQSAMMVQVASRAADAVGGVGTLEDANETTVIVYGGGENAD